MAPPGRRRPLSPLPLLLSLLVLFTTTASAASSAVLGLDLGTEYIKAALVKPGIPLEIVLTKDSKRKEVSAVAFKPLKGGQTLEKGSFPERFYGGDAVALQARFPADVYPNLKTLLGVHDLAGEEVQVYRQRYPAVDVVDTEGRNVVSVESGIFAEGEKKFTVEELLAMELKNVKENAKALAGKGSTIEDVVFTVPAFYTVDERRALETAARLAGFKVQAMVSDGLAVGINYAMTREFPVVTKGEKPEVHVVFDMGAGSATATVLKFQGKQVKDIGRYNKTVQEVHVLGSGWDRTLGGDSLNSLLVEDMVSEFIKLPAAKSASITADKVKAHGRTAAKLFKEAEKVRQVLSANTQTAAFFEGLYEDVDFRYKITRQHFEELAADYAARVGGPIARAVEAAGLKLEDIDSLIVHGGASRTPFVQSRLEELVGKAKIKANVNADEAAVFGAAFKAASLAPSFRVKEIRDYDTQGYNHGIQYMFNLKDLDQKIFTPATKVGATKDLPFQMMGDFTFSIYQAVPGPNGEVVKNPVLEFESGNLTRVVTKLIDEDKCDRESFNNYVQVRLSPTIGTPEIVSAWVTCETEVEEAKGGIVDGIKGFFGGAKKDQEALKESESSSASGSASASSSSSASVSASSAAEAAPSDAAKGSKKKQVRSAITFRVTQRGYGKVPRKEFKRMQDRLAAFDASDKSRRIREEHLNSLEAFTYRVRDYLEDEAFIAASTSDIRKAIEEKLSAASDWIYAEGSDASEDALKAKLKELKDVVDPVLKRKTEFAERPEALKAMREAIDGLKSVIPMVKENIELSTAAAAKAEEEAKKAEAGEASSGTASASDPLAELEEEPTASDGAPASPTKKTVNFATDAAIYEPKDLELLENTASTGEAWLAEKETLVKDMPAHEDAAVSVKEIKAEAKRINDVVVEMMSKRFSFLTRQRQAEEKARKAKERAKAEQKRKERKEKKGRKGEKKAEEETKKAEENKKEEKDAKRDRPTEEELREALEKAGIKGEGIKLENLGLKDAKDGEFKDSKGRPMLKLNLGEDASEEDILAAIDRAVEEGKEEVRRKKEQEKGKGEKEGHDEL